MPMGFIVQVQFFHFGRPILRRRFKPYKYGLLFYSVISAKSVIIMYKLLYSSVKFGLRFSKNADIPSF